MRKLKQGVFALLLIGMIAIVGACTTSNEAPSSHLSVPPTQSFSSLEDVYSSEETSTEVSESPEESCSEEESSSEDTSIESSLGGFELPDDTFN